MILIDDHIYDFDLQAALSDISGQRRRQALRYSHEHGQRTCVLAYQLLCRALSEEFGITGNPLFEYAANGKPSIAGHPEIFFSLSHCREAVACAVRPRPVGIDVESVGRYREAVARYAMSDREQALIRQAAQPQLIFTRLWTMKEALLKLTGQGIGSHMKHVLDDLYYYCDDEDHHCPYRFTTIERLSEGYLCTVCEEE